MSKLDAFEACLQQRCATAAMRIPSRICVQVRALHTWWRVRKRLCMGTLAAAVRGGACSISFSSSYTRRARSSRMIVCTCCGAASKHALAVSCGALDHLRWSQRIDPRSRTAPTLSTHGGRFARAHAQARLPNDVHLCKLVLPHRHHVDLVAFRAGLRVLLLQQCVQP